MKQRERAVTFVTNEIFPIGFPQELALQILYDTVRTKFNLDDEIVLSTGEPLDILDMEQEEILPELKVGVYMLKEK